MSVITDLIILDAKFTVVKRSLEYKGIDLLLVH